MTSDARLENCANLKTAAVTGAPETEGISLGPEMDGGGPALGRGTIKAMTREPDTTCRGGNQGPSGCPASLAMSRWVNQGGWVSMGVGGPEKVLSQAGDRMRSPWLPCGGGMGGAGAATVGQGPNPAGVGGV